MVDDVLILKTSGIPLYAKCFGGKTCKAHPDHALQSGFLAALFSYSKETFSESGIKSVIFCDFKLDFKVDEEKELILVFTNPLEENDSQVKAQLDKAHRIFVEKYSSHLDKITFDQDLFKDFEDDLVANKIVPHESKKDLPLQRETFWQRLLAKFKR
ncbi:MAG: hypothetical protein K9W42_02240 [Candidatus Heimdallarchaeota archaeon]|nr:hypothetical protein [Candidatus Heimdallarchaeota archaeon]